MTLAVIFPGALGQAVLDYAGEAQGGCEAERGGRGAQAAQVAKEVMDTLWFHQAWLENEP